MSLINFVGQKCRALPARLLFILLLLVPSALVGHSAHAQLSTPTCPGTPNALGQASAPITALPYTMTFNDVCLLKIFNSASPGVVNIPAPGTGGNFGRNFPVSFWNEGAGTLTLTPQASSGGTLPTINGQATITLTQGQGASLAIGSDGNWYANTTSTSGGIAGITAPFFNGTGTNPFQVGGTTIVDVSRNATFLTTNVTGAAAYEIGGATVLNVLNGTFNSPPFPACSGNCDTLVGAGAGALLPSADFLTTAVGFHACGSMTDLRTESTCIGWNAAGNITGIVGGNGHFLTVLGVNVLGTCTTNCIFDTLIGIDTARDATAISDSVCVGGSACSTANATFSVALGENALKWNITATGLTTSIAIGDNALFGSTATTATDNIAIGDHAMADAVTTAADNVALGFSGGRGITTGAKNVLIGWKSGFNATTGHDNVGIGWQTFGLGVLTGQNNNVIGSNSGSAMTSGLGNNILGAGSGTSITSGFDNLFLGPNSGNSCTGCGKNIIISSGQSNIDVPSANALFTMNIENIIKTSATNTPSTSVTTVAGSLVVSGAASVQVAALSASLPVCTDSSSNLTSTCPAGNGSGAPQTVTYQPGLLTAVNGTIGVFKKFVKASTVDNLIGSAITFSCVANPTITLYECGTSTTCAAPTTIGTVTVTAAGTRTDGTVSNPAITAGDSIGWAMTAGTCASLDISANAEVHAN